MGAWGPGWPFAPVGAGVSRIERGPSVRVATSDSSRLVAKKAAAGEGYSTATDLADWLVRTLKMPFRDAHHVTGRIVGLASEQGVALHELPLKAMQEVEPKITADALRVLSVEASVKSRTSYGGTAPKNVLAQAKAWAKRLEKERK